MPGHRYDAAWRLMYLTMLGRKSVPGVEVMWRGIRRLQDLVMGVLLMKGDHSDKSLSAYCFEFG